MKLQRGRLAKSFRRLLRSSQAGARMGHFRCGLESLETRTLLAADLGQNPTNYLDVNNDGIVSALDALVIINDLNSYGSHSTGSPLSGTTLTPLSLSTSGASSSSSSGSGTYLDVNGDGMVTPLDALLVANVLNVPGPSIIAQLVAIDGTGAVISTSGSTQNTVTINQGQDFSLVLRVTDVRTTSDANNNFGVFAGYTDIAITNSGLASLGALVQHGTDYPNGLAGTISTSFIDAAGGVSANLSHLDKSAHLLWSTSVHTTGAGTLTFSPDFDRSVNGDSGSSVVAGHEFLLYGENSAVSSTTDVLFKPLVVTINSATPPTVPTVSITSDVSHPEGNVGDSTDFVFTVQLSSNPTTPVVVYAVTQDTGSGSGNATAGSDYNTVTQTLTFNPGTTSQNVTVTVNGDNTVEPDETFNLRIANPINATLGTALRTGTIVNDDGLSPSMSIGNVTVTSQTVNNVSAIFPVTLSAAAGQTVTVQFATSGNTAVAGSDFTTTSGTLTFTAGQTTANITVPVLPNTLFELTEDFTVTLSNPTNATISNTLGTGTILSPVSKPTLVINNPSVAEGNSGTTNLVFTINQSAASTVGTTFVAATSDGMNVDATMNATAGSDYTAQTATLTIPAGQTSITFTVQVNGDTTFERDEQLQVSLSSPVNATIQTGAGVGVITNDDAPPVISISDPAAVNEGNAGTTPIVFTLTRTSNGNLPSTVAFATSDGTATIADVDYQATSGTITFTAGQTTATVTVLVNGDTKVENNETFSLNLSSPTDATLGTSTATATITNDDTGVTFSIANASPLAEGDSGTKDMIFTVTKSGSTALSSTVVFATADGTATIANNDYQATSGTLTFAANETSKTITVKINGDTTVESDETFTVNLSNATGGSILTASGTGTILNDDGMISVSVSASTSVVEGNSGTTAYVFNVTANNLNLNGAHTVVINTADGNNNPTLLTNATAGSDYDAITNQTISFSQTSGSQAIPVTVLVHGDTAFEHNEQFQFLVTDPTSTSSILNPTTIGTINNDDAIPIANVTVSSPVAEPANGVNTTVNFTVSLSAASGIPAVLVLTPTASGTNPATAGVNFDGTPQTITIAAGATSATVPVTVTGDDVHTQNITFQGVLTTPSLSDVTPGAAATLTITDAQSPPIYGFIASDIHRTIVEGNSDHQETLTFQLTGKHRGAITIPFKDLSSGANHAVVGTDYTLDTTSVTFADNSTSASNVQSANVLITIKGNTVFNVDKIAMVSVDATTEPTARTPFSTADGAAVIANITIQNDDAKTASVSSVQLTEGNSGNKNFVFGVTLSTSSSNQITIPFHTADGNNADSTKNATTANNDYVATSGTLTFTAGQTTANITVPVVGDTTAEQDEQFQVILDSINGDSAFQISSSSTGIGTILDDDAGVSIADVSQAEGNSGFTDFVFAVTNSLNVNHAVMVIATTSPTTNATVAINATPGVDYVSKTQTLTFGANGASTQFFTVQVKGDTTKEADQTFQVKLSTVSGDANAPTISATHGSATGTILNDDSAVQTVSVSGKVFVDSDNSGTQNGTEAGISGVAVHLSGTTDEGAAVADKMVYTDPTGHYSFDSLSPGSYSVTEDKPVLYGTATVHVGSAESVLINNAQGYGATLHGDTGNSTGGSFSHIATTTNTDIFSRRGYLTTTGTTPSVVQTGTTLVIQGTSGNDTVNFTAGTTTNSLVVNGVTYTLDPAKVHDVVFDGFGGDDTATLTGGTGTDTADATIGSGTLTGSNYKVTVTNIKTLTMNGGTGDTANLHDTALSDLLDASGAAATLSNGTGKTTVVNGFATVNASSLNGGTDTINQGTIAFVLNKTGNWTI